MFRELSAFLKAKVRQVKFCDRTFNCRPEHCEAIWQFIIEQDNFSGALAGSAAKKRKRAPPPLEEEG